MARENVEALVLRLGNETIEITFGDLEKGDTEKVNDAIVAVRQAKARHKLAA